MYDLSISAQKLNNAITKLKNELFDTTYNFIS